MSAPIKICLHPNDNVVVARMDILANTKVEGEVAATTRVPSRRWLGSDPWRSGARAASARANQIIGFRRGHGAGHGHWHAHQVMGDFERDYAFCADAHPTSTSAGRNLLGHRRADGYGNAQLCRHRRP
jgi:altronate hydrolase